MPEVVEEILEDSNDELFEKFVFKIDKGQEPTRIDKYLMNRIEGATRNKVQQSIEADLITVNGKPIKSNYKIRPLDEIVVFSETSPASTDVVPEKMDLNIMFEDDDIIIIDKPAGLVVHPGSGNYTGTLLNGIAYYLQEKNPTLTEQELTRYGLVHRIDKNTTGLLVLAKNSKASADISQQFFNKTSKRKYIALVWGNIEEDQGTIDANIARHKRFRKLFEAYPNNDYGKEARTHFKVLERFHYVTLVECVLETGRTHQIRVHMKHKGHPLFNDDTYGGNKILKGTIFNKYKQFVDNAFDLCKRQALHAMTLGFIHPTTKKEVFFESPLPEDMTLVIDKWRRYVNTNHNN